MINPLELAEWRREVSELYAVVRAQDEPQPAHALWRERRDRLFREHPESPLPPGDPLRQSGLAYWPYDPGVRFELPLLPADESARLTIATGAEETTRARRVGAVQLPAPLHSLVDVWWLEQYGGGLFLPLRDGTAGDMCYGGGRYLLDTVKGADLGARGDRLVVDLNFLYHPSCRYNDDWQCPLAPAGNTISAPVPAGERL
jgi:uncharacterized protein (DUF1684 family)